MLEKKKLLIIADKSTLHSGARGIQANMVINALSSHYNIFLITSDISIPDNENYFNKKYINIIKINKSNRFIRKILFKILLHYNFRDYFWAIKAKTASLKICRNNDIKNVLTLSFPTSNADVGIYLKKRININLLSYFSDPISLNPYIVSKFNFFRRIYLEWYENKIYKLSNKIIVPSHTMKIQMINNFSRIEEKLKVIPHCYKQKLGRHRSKKKNFIQYFGLLNLKRTPIPLLKHIKSNAEFYINNKITFIFYGDRTKLLKFKLQFNRYEKQLIKFSSNIPYNGLHEIYNESLSLLFIDANFDYSPFLPSKLIEYFSYEKPIIGITPVNSESMNILNEYGHFSVSEENLDILPSLILEILNKKKKIWPAPKKYNIQNITKEWVEIIG